jgi:hypothetical protein
VVSMAWNWNQAGRGPSRRMSATMFGDATSPSVSPSKERQEIGECLWEWQRERGLVSEKEKGSHVTDLGSKPVERGLCL